MHIRSHRLAWIMSLVLLAPLLAGSTGQLPYDTEYDVIQYSTRAPSDAVAGLQRRIETGEVELRFDAERGYLVSLLGALDVSPDSQLLVFSRTSFQINQISPQTPRALYFNDDVYIGWLQDADVMEIASIDPDLGVVFYTLRQEPGQMPRIERQNAACLRCHDTYSLTGGGVPRLLVGSGFTDQYGGFATHEGWHLTTYQSPLEERWGGWYVTGTHGDQRHMGNLAIENIANPAEFDLDRGANVTDLSDRLDTESYLTGDSDIVALMVFEHQTTIQSLMVRVNFETRKLLARQAVRNGELGLEPEFLPPGVSEQIESWTEPLVGALLSVGEPALTGPIEGTSDFAGRFARQGPRDSAGRSLRELDLNTRLFRYPCSYLIYSPAFDALPGAVQDYVYRRLTEILEAGQGGEDFAYLSAADRRAILEILRETHPQFAAYSGG